MVQITAQYVQQHRVKEQDSQNKQILIFYAIIRKMP